MAYILAKWHWNATRRQQATGQNTTHTWQQHAVLLRPATLSFIKIVQIVAYFLAWLIPAIALGVWKSTAVWMPLAGLVAATGFYSFSVLRDNSTVYVLRRGIRAGIVAGILAAVVMAVLAQLFADSTALLLWYSLSATILGVLLYSGLWWVHQRTSAANACKLKVLLIGEQADIAEFTASQPSPALLPIDFVGYYTMLPESSSAITNPKFLGNLLENQVILAQTPIDHVLIISRHIDQRATRLVLHKTRALSATISHGLLPLHKKDRTDAAASVSLGLNSLFPQLHILELRKPALRGHQIILKRALDIVASTGAIFLLSPILLVCAAAVKFTSPGTIFFRQPRWGQDGATFYIYKFRSMYSDHCDDGKTNVVQATRTDQRVTRVGRVLRQYSLDELPQLFNIFKGDMSLIGPRPHAVAHNEYYAERIALYIHRHRVKPGLSGLAQVNGYRGETARLALMEKRIGYDVAYIRRWSLWLDIQIIFRTIKLVVSRQNAY